MSNFPINRPNPVYRHHCTGGPILSPRETAWLVDVLVEHEQRSLLDKHTPAMPDWDDVTARFNAEFGVPHRAKSELLCAVRTRNEDFWTEFFKVYVEMIKRIGY